MNFQSSRRAIVGRVRRWLNGEYVVTPHKPGMGLTRLQQFMDAFRQRRQLLSKVGHPSAGISGMQGLTSSQRKEVYWMLVALAVVAVAIATLKLLNPRPESRDEFLVSLALQICFLTAIAPSVLLADIWDKKYGGRSDGRTFVGWLLVSVIAGLMTGHLAQWGLNTYFPQFSLEATESQFRLLVTFLPEFAMLALVIGMYGRFLKVGRWQRRLQEEKLKREAAEHGQALAQAQLKMLQAQIEPHFLFNTLASVQHLVRKDPPRADFLLSQLIRYLREAMPDIRGMGSTLGREFGLAEAYLNIVKIRLDGRLEIKVNIAHELADISFPVLIVQTLVENAIKHGIEPKPGPVHIDVTATETMVEGKQFIDVCVSDDGVGFGVAETMGSGIGLRNIRERLAGLYGPSARLDITNAMPSGVCATVRIPGRI